MQTFPCGYINMKHKWLIGNFISLKICKSTKSKYLKIDVPFNELISMLLFSMLHNIAGLVQERCNSIANALELHLSCTNPSKWCVPYPTCVDSLAGEAVEWSMADCFYGNGEHILVSGGRHYGNMDIMILVGAVSVLVFHLSLKFLLKKMLYCSWNCLQIFCLVPI